MRLQDCAEEYVQYLMDKIARICSQLDPMHGESPCEMPKERSCPVIREQFDPFGPEEVDRVSNQQSQCHHL